MGISASEVPVMTMPHHSGRTPRQRSVALGFCGPEFPPRARAHPMIQGAFVELDSHWMTRLKTNPSGGNLLFRDRGNPAEKDEPHQLRNNKPQWFNLQRNAARQFQDGLT